MSVPDLIAGLRRDAADPDVPQRTQIRAGQAAALLESLAIVAEVA